MVKLGDICTNQSSNIKQGDLDNCIGEYPIYGASGFIKNVDFYKQEKPYVGIVKDGAGIGRVMLLPAYSSIIGTMQYIIPNPDTDVKYLAYAMEHMNLAKYFSGATIPHIYFKDYKNEPLKEHDLETQKQIAANLDKATQTIDLCNAILEKLDLLVKARFVEMFGDPLRPQKSELLSKVAKLERGRFSPRPRNDPQYYDGEYPFVQTGDIANCDHRLSEYNQTLNEKGIKVSKCFSAGTILIAIVGATIGATAILQKEMYAPDSIIGITVYDRYDSIFLEFLLRFWKDELLRIAPESARANINLEILGKLPVLTCPLDKQKQFAAFVEKTDRTKAAVKQVLAKAEALKKALMQEYFG